MKLSYALQVTALNKIIEFDFIIYLAIMQKEFSFTIAGIPLVLGDNFYPFSLKRKQFLVKVAFSITANKREGQTLKKMGINLPLIFPVMAKYMSPSHT